MTIAQLAAQKKGEAYVVTKEASVEAWQLQAHSFRVRPTCAMPGGTTQTAVSEDT